MKRWSRAAAVGLIALALASCSALLQGCGADDSVIVLDVLTTLEVPREQDALSLDVETVRGQPRAHFTKMLPASDSAGSRATPVRFKITAQGDDATADGRVLRITGLRGRLPVIVREVELTFVAGETRYLRIVLERACVDVACSAGLTCAAGACVSRIVDVTKLPRLVPPLGTEALPDAAVDGTDAPVADAAPAGPDRTPADADATDGPAVDVAPAEPAWSDPIDLEHDALSRSWAPSVCIDRRHGDAIVAWHEDGAIRARRHRASTDAWEVAKTVQAGGHPQDVTVACDEAGGAVAVWRRTDDDADLRGTWASRTVDGVAWQPPMRLSAEPALQPHVAVNASGKARVALQIVGKGVSTLATTFFDGASWTPTEVVAPGQSSWSVTPIVGLDASGNALITFSQPTAGSAEFHVWAARYAGAARVGTPKQLDRGGTDAYENALDVAPDGRAVAAWYELRGDGEVWLASFAPATGWSAATRVPTSGFAPAVSMDRSGDRATLVWAFAGDHVNAFAARGNLVEASWTEPQALETSNLAGYAEGEDLFPAVTSDAHGNVHAIWRRRLMGEASVIVTRRFDGARGAWSAERVFDAAGTLNATTPGIAAADATDAIAVYNLLPVSGRADARANNIFAATFR